MNILFFPVAHVHAAAANVLALKVIPKVCAPKRLRKKSHRSEGITALLVTLCISNRKEYSRRGSSRDYDRHRDRSRERDRWGGAPGRRSSRDDRDGARRSKDFERSSRRSSRSPERSRDKDRSYR